MKRLYEILLEGTGLPTDNIQFTKPMSDAIEKYVRECCEASLKQAAENAETQYVSYSDNDYEIDKSSIIHPDNIVIL